MTRTLRKQLCQDRIRRLTAERDRSNPLSAYTILLDALQRIRTGDWHTSGEFRCIARKALEAHEKTKIDTSR